MSEREERFYLESERDTFELDLRDELRAEFEGSDENKRTEEEGDFA